MRKPISITIEADNLLWLKAQAAATSKGSVSDVVDRLVRDARLEGRTGAIRSVVGTVDLPHGDLDRADGYVRSLFDRSLSRPMLVKERPPAATRAGRGRGRKRRG
ncbi:MAG: hypothetical protein DMF84_05925 [Acidobacteria bacterium]|nr:MAG: hypothetical protein DMF84_05925 [Acidobacteriota bacterium]